MTSNDPNEIREDIDATRHDLSRNVDALTDRTNPKNIAHRQGERVRGAMSSAKDKVFGSVSDASDTVSDQAGHAADLASEAPQRIKEKAEGNPLAAGLVAFGLGLLAAGLIPSSATERELASQAKESDAVNQTMDEAKAMAQESAEHLKEPARQAAEEVKSTASEGVSDVQDTGREAVDDVKGQAQDSARHVQDTRER